MFLGPILAYGRRAFLALCIVRCAASTAQQPEPALTITTNTREVQLPVAALRFEEGIFNDVLDLTAKNFHVDVGGREQSLTQVTLRKVPAWEVHDDYGYHVDMGPAFGIWSEEDYPIPYQPYVQHYYLVFTPNGFDKDSCYKVRVSVDRPGIKLEYPSDYCGTTSPADPLGGTAVGLRLEAELASVRKAQVNIDSSEGMFLSNKLKPTLQFTLEFPASVFHLQDHWDHLSAPIALVGRLTRPAGGYSGRFSDAPFGSDYWIVTHFDYRRSPNDIGVTGGYQRYTRQFDAPTGAYSFEAVVDNGRQFGRVDRTISVPVFDPVRLWVSSVFLCRRFHKATQVELERLPSQYTPLVSEGTEFLPAGDTRFTRQERLHLWFQIYAPPRPVSISSSIHYEIKLVNLQTGQIQSDTGVSSVQDFLEPGKSIVPVWKEVLIGKLAPGAYRVDVQAIDSVTGSTAQSSNTFTMVKKK